MTAKETRQLSVGTFVYCTVYACEGWYRILEIRLRDGYIKINGGWNVWCPPHNFRMTDREGQSHD